MKMHKGRSSSDSGVFCSSLSKCHELNRDLLQLFL